MRESHAGIAIVALVCVHAALAANSETERSNLGGAILQTSFAKLQLDTIPAQRVGSSFVMASRPLRLPDLQENSLYQHLVAPIERPAEQAVTAQSQTGFEGPWSSRPVPNPNHGFGEPIINVWAVRPVMRPALAAPNPVLGAGQFEQLVTDSSHKVLSSVAKEKAVDLVASAIHPRKYPMYKAELRCLANALYFEARGESPNGLKAVAEVIMNRVKSSRFPDSICAVVHQGPNKKFKCQFSFLCDGKPENVHEPIIFKQIEKLSIAYLAGGFPALTDGATHFHSLNVRPAWADRLVRTTRIGRHIFYREAIRR